MGLEPAAHVCYAHRWLWTRVALTVTSILRQGLPLCGFRPVAPSSVSSGLELHVQPHFLLNLKIVLISVVCGLYVQDTTAGTCSAAHAWRAEDTQGVAFLLHLYLGPGEQTRAIGLGGKCGASRASPKPSRFFPRQRLHTALCC